MQDPGVDSRRRLLLGGREGEKATSFTEVDQRNQELERTNLALSTVIEGLEDFAFVVSHDLREPVRAMAAQLQDAEESLELADAHKWIHEARASNDRLARLLQGLIEIAQAGRLDERDLHAVRIRDVLESPTCFARYADYGEERGAVIETVLAPDAPAVLATEGHVSQIMGNLILNALKHNPKASPLVLVHVGTAADGQMVEVTVEDNGPGFDAANIDGIGRLKPGRASMIRGGFGLVIVRRATERLGGRLWLGKSEKLGGAAVHFTLPAVLEQNVRPVSAA